PLLPSPRTVTPMPAMVKRLPTLSGVSGDPSAAAVFPLGGTASCSNATSAVARCPDMACMLKPGWMATVLTSCNEGCRSTPYSTILYSAPDGTQCAAVSTSFGAINAPVQKLPREPTMVTTERATPSVDGAPPPTMACTGPDGSRARLAIKRDGILIAAAIARATHIAKRWIGLVPAHIPC